MSSFADDLVWVPIIDRSAGPVYRSIADALEEDIRAGRITQEALRQVADLLAEAPAMSSMVV